MTRRWTLLAGALALCLGAPQAAVAAEQQPSSPGHAAARTPRRGRGTA